MIYNSILQHTITTLSAHNTTVSDPINHPVSNPTINNILKAQDTFVNKKIREGFTPLDDTQEITFERLFILLKNNTSNLNGYMLPMKAFPYQNDYIQWPRAAQRKINGIRGSITLEYTKDDVDLFSTNSILATFKMFNKTGLPVMVKHLIPNLETIFKIIPTCPVFKQYSLKIEDIILDGEFYIHGIPLGQINGAVINSKNVNHKDLSFICFDIKLPIPQKERLRLLKEINFDYKNFAISDKLSKGRVVLLPYTICTSDEEALLLRNKYLTEGFEGAIFRDLDAIYQPTRTRDMMKYKRLQTMLCKIVDVVPYKKDPTQGMFAVQNLTNNTIVESVIKSETGMNTTAMRKDVIENRNTYIGQYILVEYREITEAGKLFHTNAIFESLRSNYNN